MVVTVNLDSFWVGFVAAWISLFVIGIAVNLFGRKKKTKR